MRPAGNDNKGAMKLRVDFKQKHPGKLTSLFGNLEQCLSEHAYDFSVNIVCSRLVSEKKVKVKHDTDFFCLRNR